MSYVPDFLEMLENAAERAIEKNTFLDGHYRCPGCGEKVDLADTLPASASPYSIPLCRTCIDPPEEL